MTARTKCLLSLDRGRCRSVLRRPAGDGDDPRASRRTAHHQPNRSHRSERHAKEHGSHRLGAEHLLLALCEERESVAAVALDQLQVREAVRARLLEIMRDPGYLTGSRRVADAEGRLLGHFETDDEGRDVFVDAEGVRRSWPDAADLT